MFVEFKRCLYALFGQFGKVIDVVCMKTPNLRGQAWIVFADIESATNALRATQEFPFFGKNMVSSGLVFLAPKRLGL
jgi:U2 small nuclear ribonucleoprotein B''